MIEYTLLITFIAIACLFLVGSGRPAVNSIWHSANTTLTQANTTAAF